MDFGGPSSRYCHIWSTPNRIWNLVYPPHIMGVYLNLSDDMYVDWNMSTRMWAPIIFLAAMGLHTGKSVEIIISIHWTLLRHFITPKFCSVLKLSLIIETWVYVHAHCLHMHAHFLCSVHAHWNVHAPYLSTRKTNLNLCWKFCEDLTLFGWDIELCHICEKKRN